MTTPTPQRFWLRTYDLENDVEDWSDPTDPSTVLDLQFHAAHKGRLTRIYTEAEMRERGWDG